MILHDLVRWADDLRHYLASSLNAQAVGGNTGAAIYWLAISALVSYALWPHLRQRVDSWVQGHLKRHHDTHVAPLMQAHHEDMKQHVANILGGNNDDPRSDTGHTGSTGTPN